MTEYLLVLIYIIWLVYHYDFRRCRYGLNFHISLLCIILTLMAGLSYRLGVDCIRYEYYFNDVYPALTDFSFDKFKYLALLGDPGWVFLNSICKLICNEFYLVKIITAIFFNVTLFWFIKKYSSHFFTTILLYFILNYWNFNFQILRESIAIAFFLIAFDKLLKNNKSYLKYYLWLIPAIFFHTFGFIAIFFPLFFNLKNTNIKLTIVLLAIILPILPLLIGKLASLGFLSGTATEKLTEKYLVSEQYSKDAFNIGGILQRSIIALSALYLVNIVRNNQYKPIHSLAYLYAYVMFLILGFPIIVRVSNYLFIPFIISITHIFSEYIHKKVVKIVLILFLFSYGEMYLLNEIVWRQYVPYSSIFSKDIDIKREQVLDQILYYE